MVWQKQEHAAIFAGPHYADCCLNVQDASSFWKSVQAIPATLLAPLKPFNLSAASGGPFWNPLQPKKNISSQAFSAASDLASPYANPNPDNGNPKWKLPIPLNGSHSLAAAAADIASAPAPAPSTAVPLSEQAAPQAPVSGPTSAAALAQPVNLNPDNGNPKYRLPAPLNSSDPLIERVHNVTVAGLVPNVTLPLPAHKNLTLPPVGGPSATDAAAEAVAARAIREQQAKLAAALAQAAKNPALPGHAPNVTAHNITLPVRCLFLHLFGHR